MWIESSAGPTFTNVAVIGSEAKGVGGGGVYMKGSGTRPHFIIAHFEK